MFCTTPDVTVEVLIDFGLGGENPDWFITVGAMNKYFAVCRFLLVSCVALGIAKGMLSIETARLSCDWLAAIVARARFTLSAVLPLAIAIAENNVKLLYAPDMAWEGCTAVGTNRRDFMAVAMSPPVMAALSVLSELGHLLSTATSAFYHFSHVSLQKGDPVGRAALLLRQHPFSLSGSCKRKSALWIMLPQQLVL